VIGSIATAKDEDFERAIDTNLRSAFYTSREAANRLREGGRIINISTSIFLKSSYFTYKKK
jgi:3-oxoacyl-[acyl-carrier protein] reductase